MDAAGSAARGAAGAASGAADTATSAATGAATGAVVEALWAAEELPATAAPSASRGGPLPEALGRRYPGGLAIPLRADRPAVVANFVESIDGVVALAPSEPSSGGAEISGHSEADRFVMALLRALADVVIVGGGTARAGAHHEWTPRHVEPPLADVLGEWRASLGLAPQPTTIVVTGSGTLDPDRPGLSAPDVPVIVVTTKAGAERLANRAGRLPANLRVEVVEGTEGMHAAAATVPAVAVVDVARRAGARVALCEGGPHLFGELLGAGLVDELFLTLAPQVLGRGSAAARLGLVEGTAFGEDPGAAPGAPPGATPDDDGARDVRRDGDRWLGRASSLAAVRRAGDHLFLRYRFTG